MNAIAWVTFGLGMTAVTAGGDAKQKPAAAKPARPNFLLLVADGIGCDALRPYGNAGVQTPNLDRLAKEGMRFTQAMLTCSACSPSRCSISTGRYPHSTGAADRGVPLPADQTLVTEPLRQAGYYTAAAGRWRLGAAARTKFDAVKDGGGPGGYRNWLEVLRNRPKDKPFFVWLEANDPQRPYLPQAIPEPHKPQDVRVPPYLPDTEEVRRDLAGYYDLITRFDAKVGETLGELAKQRLAENTVVMVFSSSGPPFPRCKTTVLETGVRMPLIIRWPKRIAAGSVCASLASSIDLAPTIVELAGAKPPAAMQGVSLAPLFAKPSATVRKFAYAERNWYDYRAWERAVRSERYAYVRNELPELPRTPSADVVRSATFQTMRRLRDEGKLTPVQKEMFQKPRPREELYDLQADPYATKNLAWHPKYAETLVEMRTTLDAWRKSTGDTMPTTLPPDRFDRETGLGLGAAKGAKSAQKAAQANPK